MVSRSVDVKIVGFESEPPGPPNLEEASLANPDLFMDDLLTEREIALVCAGLDSARMDSEFTMLAEYDALYGRWTEIANDESTLIVGDPTVGGHRMHVVHIAADERRRLRLAVDAYIVSLWEVGDNERVDELYDLAARLGRAL